MDRQTGFSLIELLIVVAIIGAISTIALPNFINSRQVAREATAIGTIRTLTSAEGTYFSGAGGYSNYGALTDLITRQLIDASFDGGNKNGYVYQITQPSGLTGYVITATPQGSEAAQMRYFYADESGVIRQNLGAPATASSPPIPSR